MKTISHLLMTAAIALAPGIGTADQDPTSLITYPAVFRGTLPCAFCEGTRTSIVLEEPGYFRLEEVFLGEEEDDADSFRSLGRWVWSNGGTMLMLFDAEGEVRRFRLEQTGHLRLLDRQGQPVVSDQNDLLTRRAIRTPPPQTLRLRGMYRYLADVGIFTECATGREFVVATEGDNAALEQSYLETREKSSDRLLVTLEGRVEARPKIEGEGLDDTLVVEAFCRVWPGEWCGEVDLPLAPETRWGLVEIDGYPVVPVQGDMPHIVFELHSRQVSGSGGCNRFGGTFKIDGQALRLREILSTRMACLEGMAQEDAFFRVLDRVTRHEIHGRVLELYDHNNYLVARFGGVAGSN